MPTYEALQRFLRDYDQLDERQREAFRQARKAMVEDLRAGRRFRNGLRVKRVQGTTSVWEMTWAPDGRATWEYGEERVAGEPHVIWRRIGTHAILGRP